MKNTSRIIQEGGSADKVFGIEQVMGRTQQGHYSSSCCKTGRRSEMICLVRRAAPSVLK